MVCNWEGEELGGHLDPCVGTVHVDLHGNSLRVVLVLSDIGDRETNLPRVGQIRRLWVDAACAQRSKSEAGE